MIYLSQKFIKGQDAETSGFHFKLVNLTGQAIQNPQLCFTSSTRLRLDMQSDTARLTKKEANTVWIDPLAAFSWRYGESWEMKLIGLSHMALCCDDGAVEAVIIEGDKTHQVHAAFLEPIDGESAGTKKQALPTSIKNNDAKLGLIPWPASVKIVQWQEHSGLDIKNLNTEHLGAFYKVSALTARLFPNLPNPMIGAQTGRLLEVKSVDMPAEHYALEFSEGRISISSGDDAGLQYAFTTLAQILVAAACNKEFKIPAMGRIEDGPRFAWRGSHLDVSRHFMDAPSIERFIDILAWLKFNRFHWHLSDDEGWRIESKIYPSLNKIASWRGPETPLAAQYSHLGETYGGFYSHDQIRAIVGKAKNLSIETMPEIDVPGHCAAMLEAMPNLRDPGENAIYYESVQGYGNNALNPANPSVFETLCNILDEIIPLFPFAYFHLGGDEVAEGAWMNSPMAKVLMEAENLAGTADMQAYFLSQLQEALRARGKNLAGWDEMSHGDGVARDALLFAWQTREKLTELMEAGYNVIATPGQAYYLDMRQGTDWSELGASWAGIADIETCYNFDPCAGNQDTTQLKGVQACIWTERIASRENFNYMVFPRLYAISEGAWSKETRKNFDRFCPITYVMPEL